MCTFSCTAHFISLHILLLILFHYLFLISFSPYLYIYSLVFCFIVLIAFMLFLFYYYFLFFCTFHWADLSWLTFHYLLYPVWLCMWQIIKNLEPWNSYLCFWLVGILTQHTGQPIMRGALWKLAPSSGAGWWKKWTNDGEKPATRSSEVKSQ